MVLATQY